MSENLPHAYYYAAGYRPSGMRAVRIDMLERLADLIRTARSEADMRQGFEAAPQMMSLVGCSGEEFEAIMRSLGLRKNVVRRKVEAQAPPSPEKPPDAAGEPAAVESAPGAAPQEAAETQTPAAEPTPVEAPSAADGAANGQDPAAATPGAEPSPEAAPSAPAQADAAPSAPAAGEAEEIEVALWRPAPRKVHKPKRETKGDGKDARKPGAKGPRHGKGKKPHDRSPRGGPLPRENMPMHKPRHRKTADPNSPFAVLAGLKSQLAEDDGKNAKESEKAE